MGVTQKTVTEDDFFKEEIVSNLAALLGVDKSRIRVMTVVSAGGKRKRRSSDLSYIDVSLFIYLFIFLKFYVG